MKFRIVEKVKRPENYGIRKYKFNDDGTLDVFENVNLGYTFLNELPFKFGKVDGNFSCFNSRLVTLEGAPKIVNGNFDCYGNNLENLEGGPEEVKDNYDCSNNSLRNLHGCSNVIGKSFYCDYNKLETLEGLNLNGVGDLIYVHHNPNLKFDEKEELWMTLNPGRLILEI